MPQPRVSIIVPARNEEAHIEKCLLSLLKQEFADPFEIIVVDNRSIDRTRDRAQTLSIRVVSSWAPSPGGVRNEGARASTGDYLAFIDGDCTAPVTWLASLVGRLETNPSLVATSGPCMAPDGANWVVKAWSPPLASPTPRASVAAANMMVRRRTFEIVGGFDESLVSAEDDDISRRLKRLGRVLSEPSLSVIHHGYPDTLWRVARKACWHGSSQLRAHGLLRDRAVVATELWALSAVVLVISLLMARWVLSVTLLVIVFVALPLLLALARLRQRSWKNYMRYLAPLVAIAVFVLAGRAVGLVLEVLRKVVQLRRSMNAA